MLFKENKYLKLNASKSKKKINWSPKYDINKIVYELLLYRNIKLNYKIIEKIVKNFRLK